jgi:aromatic-L-amino-acid decarboxylase
MSTAIELKTGARYAPLEMDPEQFRALGHTLIDGVADFLARMPTGPVRPNESPSDVRRILGRAPLPEEGGDAGQVMGNAMRLLFEHSLFNGHPRFWGYITSSAAPIGILADLLAAAVNPNCGGWDLSPMASEIEAQTVRWIAELIDYPTNAGGLLVSGGNMANFVCFLAARSAKTPWDVRAGGISAPDAKQLVVYTSSETHTWIQKAADLFGLGTDAIRWMPSDEQGRFRIDGLRERIRADRAVGLLPFLLIGTGGSVGTGAVDPLPELARIAKEEDLWFHVDGAYGALAVASEHAPDDLRALSLADSVAVDPHKWLYAPMEAGCALVRDGTALRDAFSYHASYYRFDRYEEDEPVNFYAYGPQNSRGFRALKVWLALQQVGRAGYRQMIGDDIELSRAMFAALEREPDIERLTQALSIATFRYAPKDLRTGDAETGEYLNELNTELVGRLQKTGEAYVSNAVVNGRYALRACIVNFRTTLRDVEILPALVVRIGRVVDSEMRARA